MSGAIGHYLGGMRVVPQKDRSNISQTGYPSGNADYSWAGSSEADQFKTVRKTITYPTALTEKPSQIVLSNIAATNCSMLKVKKITKSGFVIVVVGIRADECSIKFDWAATE